MEKIYYNNSGWVCNRYPNDLPVDDENRFIEVDEDTLAQTLICESGKAWKVVNGKLSQEIYNKTEHDKNVVLSTILDLKQEIAKIKEDVEQVELFGMERQDYEQKKQRCIEIVERLRVLEKQLEE